MYSNSFYVTLPSNVQSKFSNNTQSNFITLLPTNLNLSGKWEVGLCELTYVHSWDNISETIDTKTGQKSNQIVLRILEGKIAKYKRIFLPPGYYDNNKKILEEINRIFKNYDIKFSFDDITKRMTCHFNSLDSKVEHFYLSSQLQGMLGFETMTFLIKNKSKEWKTNDFITAKYPIDLSAGFHSLFIYADIVEPSIIGDKFAPILKICNIKGTFGSIVTQNFSTVHYVPVSRNQITTIQINVKNSLDNFINFNFGNLICKLHFFFKIISNDHCLVLVVLKIL